MNRSTLSRRHFLQTASLVAAGSSIAPRLLLAQTPATAMAIPSIMAQGRAASAAAKIETKPLRGGVSALLGTGGNIAVMTGKNGKLLVDSGYSTAQPQLTSALAALSAEPATHLVNTHWHFDHTDGNAWMHAAGATILAQSNCKTRLSSPQTMATMEGTVPPLPAGGIPTQTFAERQDLHLNGSTIALRYYPPAHTDGDISVYFTEADVFHAGDTWFNGFYPFFDTNTGGNIHGMIAAADRTLRDTTAKTIIIPGHGAIGTHAELVDYRDMLVAARDAVAAVKKQGRTLPETVAAKPTASLDAKWGQGFMKPDVFVGLVYPGV